MGFDEKYPIVVSDTQAYRQFGNAVAPPVVRAVAGGIMKVLEAHLRAQRNGCLIKPIGIEPGDAATKDTHDAVSTI